MPSMASAVKHAKTETASNSINKNRTTQTLYSNSSIYGSPGFYLIYTLFDPGGLYGFSALTQIPFNKGKFMHETRWVARAATRNHSACLGHPKWCGSGVLKSMLFWAYVCLIRARCEENAEEWVESGWFDLCIK